MHTFRRLPFRPPAFVPVRLQLLHRLEVPLSRCFTKAEKFAAKIGVIALMLDDSP